MAVKAKRYVGDLTKFASQMKAMGSTADMKYITQRVEDVNGPSIVTGTANYTINMDMPGQLAIKFKNSLYAHANITVDTSKAKTVPGVVLVLKGDDPEMEGTTLLGDQPFLALGKVRYSGEPVALVAAETEEAADDAVDLIEVDYDELPATVTPEDAGSQNPTAIPHEPAPEASPGRPNVFFYQPLRYKDVDAAFADSDVIHEATYKMPNDPHGPICPVTGAAAWEGSNRMHVWGDVQNIHPLPWPLSAVYAGLPQNKVTFHGPEICAAGFGGKNLGGGAFYAAFVTKLTGRPSICTFNQKMSLSWTSRPPWTWKIKIGAKNDGTFTGIEAEAYICGPYGRFMGGGGLHERARNGIAGTYRWQAAKFDGYAAYANTQNTLSYRGFSSPETCFAVELAVSELADKLGMDQVEIRLKNALNEGERDIVNEIKRSMGFKGVLKSVKMMMDEWGPKPADEGPIKYGRGICGGNKYTQGGMITNQVFLRVRSNGLVDIICDSMDLGHGLNTIWRQFVSEAMNIPIERVNKVEVNTDVVPHTSNSYSSMATFHGGYAIIEAANAAKKMIEQQTGKPYNPDDWSGIGDPTKIWGPQQFVVDGGIYAPDDYLLGNIDPETSQCLGPHYRMVLFHSHQAAAFEVAVNADTGEVCVTKAVMGADPIPANATNLEAQIEGAGLVMGMGTATTEERWMDKGIILGDSFLYWPMPTVTCTPKLADVGTVIEPIWGEAHGENPRINGPFGVKGCAEGVQAPVAQTVLMAISDAIGVQLREIPATPDKILKALGKA
ncbi:MAG: xanthine dehydrogenase family protein molybdopterin-binding subunit [Candidatus Bathyarchaeota archaeon]|nr:xanthine dehydrogenase family protein molybdopterin-binding subunit [Candidatus Bathyarchaeota archaeon]